ncbi:MAG: GIY-YIG nuclease family protein [Gammaproteobacteria bacterium]|nr:GIY-YIG nuclease family protein [Gammaproteobacteria bacterium]
MGRESQSDWFVYMLRCSDSSLYTGITNNLTKRLKHHSDGVGARYTRSRLPVELVYQEGAADRSAAQRREAQIKSLSADAKRKMITG